MNLNLNFNLNFNLNAHGLIPVFPSFSFLTPEKPFFNYYYHYYYRFIFKFFLSPHHCCCFIRHPIQILADCCQNRFGNYIILYTLHLVPYDLYPHTPYLISYILYLISYTLHPNNMNDIIQTVPASLYPFLFLSIPFKHKTVAYSKVLHAIIIN